MNHRYLFGVLLCGFFLVSCQDDPVAPPPPPPPTIAEQIAAWNPRIIVEEPLLGFNPSDDIYTVTPGDTVCMAMARFRIDSINVPDSVFWTLGARTYTTRRFSVTDIPLGLHTVQAVLHKRFRSAREGKDTTVVRAMERTFVALDNSHSLAIGKWVPVDPKEDRIDTLRVLYQEIIPGTRDGVRRNFVLGVSRGCDTTHFNVKTMYMSLRRYAVNFERSPTALNCQQVFGELACNDASNGVYRVRSGGLGRLDTILVRRAR